MADPLSRRALLTGQLWKGSPRPPGVAEAPAQAPGPKGEAPLSEVQVYGSEKPPPALSVEVAVEESLPPWRRS